VNALANNIISLVIKHIMENNGKFSFQFYIEKRGADYDFSEYNPNSNYFRGKS
jgi:hypothetical protein